MDTPHDLRLEAALSNSDSTLELFAAISDRAREVVAVNTDWGDSGERVGQYKVDLDVDDVCVGPLLAAGYDVLSEESGVQAGDGSSNTGHMVVVDPLDGSTNASLGLPWFATSLCLVVDEVPAVAMVTNLATGDRYTAVRGRGAQLDGRPLVLDGQVPMDDAMIAVSGLPARHYGWRQFRAMGASALDICAVASGAFDGFVDMSVDAHGVWDYLGALLVLEEAGGLIVDAHGRDLVVLDDADRRTPVAASGEELLQVLLLERQGSTS